MTNETYDGIKITDSDQSNSVGTYAEGRIIHVDVPRYCKSST